MWKSANGQRIDNFKQKIIQMIKATKKTKIVVGCDSQVINNRISYVTVVVILNVGHGGNFIYNKQFQKNNGSLSIMQNRLFYETIKSVDLAKEVDKILSEFNLKVSQIHSDINPDKKFKSNKVASACISLIKGNGYQAVIKPYAYAASKTADSLTR